MFDVKNCPITRGEKHLQPDSLSFLAQKMRGLLYPINKVTVVVFESCRGDEIFAPLFTLSLINDSFYKLDKNSALFMS